jgi:hypothetical protein
MKFRAICCGGGWLSVFAFHLPVGEAHNRDGRGGLMALTAPAPLGVYLLTSFIWVSLGLGETLLQVFEGLRRLRPGLLAQDFP